MTLFQAIIASLVGVCSEIYPVAPGAHFQLLEYFLGWDIHHPHLIGTIELGVFLALLFTLRHDLLSHLSSLLQVVIYRKKPTAMDERMPIFVLIAAIPSVLAFFFLNRTPISPTDTPYLFAGVFGLSGLPMIFFDSYAKKVKSIYDWNAFDAALVGLGGVALGVPEIGRTTGAFTFAALRNYKREGAAKFILYAAVPVVGVSAWYHLRGPGSALAISDFPPLYYWISLVVSMLVASFIIPVFLAQIGKNSLMRYGIYRVVVAGAVIAMHFYREGF